MSLLSSGGARQRSRVKGFTEPRFWTKPLRELNEETSLGFSVIAFADEVLGIKLFPWQKWLLIHALELNEDGSYRFDRVIVLVARQNGKTTLLNVLTLYWLFVDSEAFPVEAPPQDFLVLGTAQNLDIAEESWDKALRFCDPDEGRFGEDEVFAIPALKARTKPPVRKNGQKAVRLKNGAQYQVRAANRRGGRGKAADRVVMDELREQNTWDTWSATAKANSAKFNSQLWGISNAGDNSSVVLSEQRENLLQAVNDWDSKVVPGLLSVEDWAKQHSITHALFEWSAPDGCAVDDVDGILQANPSIGYSHLRVEKLLTDSRTEPEHIFRTESLCQWVEAMVEPYLPRDSWSECADSGSEISPGSRLMFAIDISEDRQMTYVAVAGYRDDGLIHGEVIAARAGSLWVIDFLHRLAEAQNCWDVALQPRGAPVSEFVAPLHDAGFRVVEVGGSVGLGGCCGGMHDLVFQGQFKHLDQPVLNMAADFAVARHLGEVRVWDRKGSLVDIASLVAVAEAVWALEHAAPATVDHEPPPAAEVVRAGDRMDAVSAGVDFRSVSF